MQKNIAMKRINPQTDLPFKQGDRRSDGFIFSCYLLNKKDKQGFYLERWYSEKTFNKYKKDARILNKTNNKEKRKARKNFIDVFKINTGCVDCGYNKHPEALQFDHLPDHIKNFDISKSHLKPLDIVLNEIKKCEVVCACCHAIRTHERRFLP